MKIIGIKYLNANNYKKINILHNEIFVSGDSNSSDNKGKKDKRFTDTLKGLDKKQIVSKTIEYFLQSHNIKSISNYEFSGNSVNVVGVDGVLLKIGIPIDMEVAGRLMMKYRHDRLAFIDNILLVDSCISISKVDGKSSYDYDGKSYNFFISCKGEGIRGFEREFLGEFVGRMLSDREVIMTREAVSDNSCKSMISFLERSDDSTLKYREYYAPTIIIDNDLVSEIETITINHNKKYYGKTDKDKVLEKRMEEFK